MRFRLLIFLITLICIPFASFARNYSVSFNGDDVRQAIAKLKQTTDYEIVYQKDLIKDLNRKISGNFKEVSLDELLEATVERQMGLAYKIVDKTITLCPPAAGNVSMAVTGVVVDEEGEPLPGASVIVKGTTNGVSTDIDGKFKLDINGKNPVLLVSYVGMDPAEYRVTSADRSKPVSITLRANAAMMGEVVVTGFQNLKKENVTGAFQQVTSSELDTRSVSSLTSNLEGKVAGMVVNGDDIQIRGTSTLAASTSPLIVVDGLPIEGTLNDVNPYEVDKVFVLKDAAAAAVYGARASNGVIVITTKKGVGDNVQVEFNADFTVFNKLNYNDLNRVDAAGLLSLEENNFNWMINDEYANNQLNNQWSLRGTLWNPMNQLMMRHQLGEVSDADYNRQVAEWKSNSYSGDWDDAMLHNRFEQRYNLAVRTRSKVMSNNIALNWTGDNTYQTNSHNNKLSLRYMGDIKPVKWFGSTLGLQVDNIRTKGKLNSIGQSAYNGAFTGKFDLTGRTSFPEYLGFLNADGTPARLQAYVDLNEPSLSDTSLGLKDEGFVPLDELELNTSEYRSTYTRGYVHLNFYPLDGLELSGKFQFEDLTGKRSNTAVGESYAVRHLYNLFTENGKHKLADGGIYDETSLTNTSYTFRFQATYDKTIKDLHSINAVAGYEYRYLKDKSNSSAMVGYDEKNLTHYTGYTNFQDLVDAKATDLGSLYSANNIYMANDFGSFNEVEHKFLSYYATANYTFDHKYTVSGSYRIDEADLFGADKKFTRRPLWSIGAGWNAHNEAFLSDITWISQLKPRLSYGVTGNINSNYSSYLTASIYSNPLVGAPRAILDTPPNDQLRWEKTKTFDVGVDFGFFNYRLNGSIDYYNKQGSDILSLVDLDPTTGWSSLNMNNAATRNRGFEIQLNGEIIQAPRPQNVGLRLSASLAYNNNKITKIKHVSTTGWNAIQVRDYKEGRPVNSLYSFRYGGVTYDEDGYQSINWIDSEGELNSMDIQSSAFTPDDVVYSGNLDPKWSGSFTPTVTYQNFTLSAMAAFYLGHYMRINYNKWSYTTGMSYGNSAPAEYLAYWQTPEAERVDMIGNGYMMEGCSLYSTHVYFSDQNVDHADYMKLRNIVLTYSFPGKICRKIGLSSLRLRAQANNVATWARNKENIDPERVNFYTGEWSVGTPRSYTFSVSATF